MVDPKLRALPFPLFLMVSVACSTDPVGGTSGADSQGATGGAAGTTGSTGEAEEDTEPGGSEETGSESSGSEGGASVCVPPEDEELGGTTTVITIRNNTDTPRFLSPYAESMCDYDAVQLFVEGEKIHRDHEDVVVTRCDQCDNSCSNGGAPGLIINPGAVAEIPWNGGFWTPTERSEACVVEACEELPGWDPNGAVQTPCSVLRSLEDGVEYTARIHVLDACPIGDADACACDKGVCVFNEDEPSQGDSTVEATAAYPAGADIVLD